ncbi:hypothetical protein [Streptomyces sp. NPDC048473]|uniref:hypothetical protein n=1 Tax=Streptomyces sp. NPDC048473 TaxID=3365556 RepID=UPI003722C3AB
MSFEAVLWATNDAPIANVNEFAVLTMLAEKADPDGCNSFPSRPTVAARTTVDPKTVLRALQAMEARGMIAQGDQRAAEYIRADRRPVVYDLLIPYSWFPNIDRINRERQERGRPPLTRSTRPDIAPAPEKKQRSDKGKPRAKKQPAEQRESSRGDFESPRDSDGYGVTLSPARGDSQSGTGGLQVTQTSPVTLSTTPNDSVRPSVFDVQVPDASGSGTDGRTDGGGVGVEEQRPVAAGGAGPAAGAAPNTNAAARAGGAPVEMTPGVEVLRAIAAEASEWTITHAESLRDQGLMASGMLLEGFTAQEIRHALLSQPLPRPLTHTVGAVVKGRLRDLLAAGPASAVRPIPAQTSGDPRQPTERRADLSSAASVSWAERQQQLAAATSGHGPQRDCQGETCSRLALPGEDLCARCLREVDPVCAAGCGRTVVAESSMCIPCVDAADTARALGCPGHDGPCGRTVQTVTGLCWKCEAARTQARQESDADLSAALANAAAAVAAEESSASF